ncbi:MAG TPA: hypothetical protein VF062_12900 [Candidatus Limnocylindrales bacterium]
MMRGFEKDEGFWEVGLHLFLMLLISLPTAFLLEGLAVRTGVVEHGPILFGFMIGVVLGNAVVGLLGRKFPRMRQEANGMQPLYLILPIALAVAVLFDHLVSSPDGRDGAYVAFGIFIAMDAGDRVFHRLRRMYRQTAPEEPSDV